MHIRLKTRIETRKRHAAMRCRVFEVKIDKSHLSKKERRDFDRLFLEAKWFYNYCVQNIPNLKELDTKAKSVKVKVMDAFEDRELRILSGQMKQGIRQRLWTNLVSLSASKKTGNRVGRIGFKPVVNCIPLKQFGSKGTYDIDGNRVYVQNFKRGLRANGLEQIPEGAEIANAHLVRKHGDLFLKITTYSVDERPEPPDRAVGLDFGCMTPITTSEGIKIEFSVPVSRRVRRLDRWLGRHKKDKESRNRLKMLAQREKAYAKLENKRRDIGNKIVNVLTRNFGVVCLQDENVKGWQAGGHGKAVSKTGIGGITAALKNRAATPVVVDRFFPSTRRCSRCGYERKMERWERTYECPACGLVMDRDWNASVNILVEGMRKLPEERRKPMPPEGDASGMTGLLDRIPGVHVKLCPANGEAPA